MTINSQNLGKDGENAKIILNQSKLTKFIHNYDKSIKVSNQGDLSPKSNLPKCHTADK